MNKKKYLLILLLFILSCTVATNNPFYCHSISDSKSLGSFVSEYHPLKRNFEQNGKKTIIKEVWVEKSWMYTNFFKKRKISANKSLVLMIEISDYNKYDPFSHVPLKRFDNGPIEGTNFENSLQLRTPKDDYTDTIRLKVYDDELVLVKKS